MPDDTSSARRPRPLQRLTARVDSNKVSVGTVIVFIVLLACFCLLAAGIGYLTHHFPLK